MLVSLPTMLPLPPSGSHGPLLSTSTPRPSVRSRIDNSTATSTASRAQVDAQCDVTAMPIATEGGCRQPGGKGHGGSAMLRGWRRSTDQFVPMTSRDRPRWRSATPPKRRAALVPLPMKALERDSTTPTRSRTGDHLQLVALAQQASATAVAYGFLHDGEVWPKQPESPVHLRSVAGISEPCTCSTEAA